MDVDRTVLLRHKISDIKLFFENELRILKQLGREKTHPFFHIFFQFAPPSLTSLIPHSCECSLFSLRHTSFGRAGKAAVPLVGVSLVAGVLLGLTEQAVGGGEEFRGIALRPGVVAELGKLQRGFSVVTG